MTNKIKTFHVLLLVILFFNVQNIIASSKDRNEMGVFLQSDEAVFSQKLKNALTYLESVCGQDGIKKVVVLKGGEIVFKGIESEVMQNTWSCTKSFTSTVLGLLIADGKCSIDDKVGEYFPELKANYPTLTFRHLATMTSGYKAKGDDEAGAHGQSSTPFQPSLLPLSAPGTEFRYWDSAMNTFALVLTKVAGEPIETYFKRKVANPIGMDAEKWDWKDFGKIDGTIVNGGAGNKSKGVFMSAGEMARFGQLFLNKGNWDGQQIIPKHWVEDATSPQVKKTVPNDNTPYGFNWWTAGTFPDAPKGTFAAKGFNNNKCIVVPEWKIVVARLGLDGNIDDEKWNNFLKLIGEAVNQENDTKVSIQDGKWYFNNKMINPDSPAEGLLMNVRMVNSVFEDRGAKIPEKLTIFNPRENADSFIAKIPEYVNSGVNAFTISLQGGFPGYEGAINTAFNPDGSMREGYLKHVEKVIRVCDTNKAAVILSCFYQRQHSHFSALKGKESIENALKNTVAWITERKFTNVVLEVSNEYRHGGYRNWPDGDWLMSEAGQVELIQLAKQQNSSLLVSTSGMGTGKLEEPLIAAADFLLIHFNNTSLNDYRERIKALKKYKKPIVCNEDDKLKQAGAMALSLSVLNGCSWGYMNSAKNQNIPFEFAGVEDDTLVYIMFKNVTTPGYQIDPGLFNQTFVMITSPNDGQVFTVRQNVRIQISVINPPESVPYHIEILANNEPVSQTDENLQANWLVARAGVFVLEAVIKNSEGAELCRSPKADIIVQPIK